MDGVSGFGVADGTDDGVRDGETAGSPALRYGEGLGGVLDVVEGEDLGAGSPPDGGGGVFQDDLDGRLDETGPGGGPVTRAGGSAHDQAGDGSGAFVGDLFVGGLVEDVVERRLDAGGSPGLLLQVGFLVSPIEGTFDSLRSDEALACFDGSGEEAVGGQGVGGGLAEDSLELGDEVFLAGSGVVLEPGDSVDGGALGVPGGGFLDLPEDGSVFTVFEGDLVELR